MKKKKPDQNDAAHNSTQKNAAESTRPLKDIVTRPWFSPSLFLVLSLLYFSPYLGLNKAIIGTDDGPRGWHTIGNHGHGLDSFFDKWSPLNGGTAMMERRFGRFINPTHIFHLIMPKYKARTLEYIFWTFIAGMFMFLFLRTLGISKIPSYVCASAFMFAPSFQSYIFAGHFARMEVIALMPGIMFFVERMLKKINILNIIGLTTIMALCVYSEHLQLAYFTFLGMGFYFALRMLHLVFYKKEISISEGSKRTGVFVIALIIFTFLTSMNTFPSIQHTNVTSKRAGGVDYEYASSFALHPEEIFSLFQPDFIGWKEFYWGQNPLKLNLEYFGVLFFVLAIMLFFIRKQDFKKYLFAGFFIFAVFFSIGAHTPLHKMMYYLLPGMKSFRAPSFMYVWFVLSGLVLAGYALDELLSYKWDENPKRNKRLLIFGAAVCGIALMYMLGSKAFANFWYNSVFPAEMQGERKYNALMNNMKKITFGGVITFFILGVFFTALYFKTRNSISTKVFIAILVILSCIDLFRLSRPFLTQAVKPNNYFLQREKVEQSIEKYLHQRDESIFRVHAMLGDQKMYIPNLELTYIFDDFINKRYHDITQVVLSAAYGLAQPQYANNPTLHNRLRNGLSILNTKYFFALSPFSISGIREIINSGGLRVYENMQVFPRFFLADNIKVEEDSKAAILQSLDAPYLDRKSVVIDQASWEGKSLNNDVDTNNANTVTVRKYDPRNGHIKLDVKSNREQLLVISENYSYGWTATIEKKPTEIFPANYYAKALIVPKGSSEVELIYNSPVATFWRKINAVAAILFLVFCCAVLFLEVKRFKQK